VKVFSVGQVEDRPYIDMELVEGESLKEILLEHPSLDVALAISLLRNVLKALEYIHDRGIVHRDLKPSNVMVANGRAKLIDFSIAKLQSSRALTRTGTVSIFGTELYMAPEQWKNNACPQSDLFAAGLLLSSMLGVRPEVPNVAPDIARSPLAPPSMLVDWYKKSVSYRCEDRFENARAMRLALNDADC